MNFRTNLREYSVSVIAVSSDRGRAMQMEMNVTARVPDMNGRNPNFFCDGFQSDDVMRSQNEFSCRIGSDLTKSPAIIAISRSIDDNVNISMNADDRFCL